MVLVQRFHLIERIERRVVWENRGWMEIDSYSSNRSYAPFRELFLSYGMERCEVVFVGDSLVSEVSWNELLRRTDVGNRGIPGDTSQGAENRIGDYLQGTSRIVVLWVGSNDWMHGLKANDSAASLRKMVDSVREKGRTPIVFTVPPVAKWIDSADDRNRFALELNQRVLALADQLDFPTVDAFSFLVDEHGALDGRMTRDGIHLSAAAYALIADRIEQILEELIKIPAEV